ncbi:hypothetical protein P879_12003 [Paragonimus westermani]|uniref:Uncharacterized protein n=1 Tax=Paragonimus westermani TaxID=34504 RepID=A0A8T0D487_9TREM|nr:hypothetical protein P879_12003 [Paragonimus westermani]
MSTSNHCRKRYLNSIQEEGAGNRSSSFPNSILFGMQSRSPDYTYVLTSKFEPSTNQLRRAIHSESLGKWANTDFLTKNTFMRVAHEEIPLLRVLGYSNTGIPPNYRKLPVTLPELA